MNKIINTQDALDAIDANVGILYDSPTLVTSLKKMVNGLSPVDAVPVRHGRWRNYEGMLTCSECGMEFYDDIMEYCGDHVPKFCPDCGARMDGDDD